MKHACILLVLITRVNHKARFKKRSYISYNWQFKQLSFKKELHELEYLLICEISTGNTTFCYLWGEDKAYYTQTSAR